MRVSTLLAIVSVAVSPATAWAWGSEGHSIVAEIAEHRLTPEAEAEVQFLLQSEQPSGAKGRRSLASVSSWADDYRASHKETANWHFVDIPINVDGVKPEDVRYSAARDCIPAKGQPAESVCLVKALQNQIDILAAPVDRNDAVAVAKRLMALKFVVHLAGDLGQPLHCSDRDDDGGGNGFHVFYSGELRNPIEQHVKLHQLWDTLLIEDIDWSWGAYVTRLETSYLKGKDEAQIAQGSIEDWANECHARGIKAYQLIPPDLTLTKPQLNKAKPIVDESLANAGVRLGAILNKALGH